MLTPKQQRFVDEYVVDLNGRQAAIRAGYAEKGATSMASQLLTNINVARAITERRAEMTERTKVDADWVLTKLVENVERAMQAIPVLDSEGSPTGEWKYEGAVANKALDLLGRHVGLWGDPLKKLEQNDNRTQIVVNISDIEQLREVVKLRRADTSSSS